MIKKEKNSKKRQWKVAIKSEDPEWKGKIWTAGTFDRVCDKHFLESDYHHVGSNSMNGE